MASTLLGEILRDERIISDLQLAEALQLQKEERSRIGDILVDLGYLTKRQLGFVIREHKRRMPLGEYLIEKGIITADELTVALNTNASTRQPLGQILVDSQIITEEQLARVLSEQLDMPYIVPYPSLVDLRVFNRLPTRFMRHNKVLPLTRREGVTVILVPGLIDEPTRLQLENVFGQDIEFAIGPPSKINQTIDALIDERVASEIRDVVADEELVAVQETDRMDISGESLRAEGVETQAIDLVNHLVNTAIKTGVSDIHLEPLSDRVQVRFRTNGMLRHKTDLPLGIRDAVFRRVKLLAGLNVTETHKLQEGRLMAHLEDAKIDLRVSVFVGIHGEAVNMRLFRHDADIMDLDDLGMTPNAYAMCRRALDYASGLIVFAGPPASGKTTSMYGALNYLGRKGIKVVSIEDPVECVLPYAIQGDMSSNRGSTLADIVSAATHQDPDVVAIGEIPNDDHARTVLSAALTGQKMLTTLHADDAAGSLLKLLEAGLKTFLRSSTPLTVVCQRLVRRLCPNCQAVFTPEPYAIRQFPIRDFDPDKYDFYQGEGCIRCQNTGFVGRTGLFEVMTINDELRDALIEGATSAQLLATARATTPFLTISEVGVLKVIRRITTPEELLRVAPLVSREREMKNPLTMAEVERISEGAALGE